jgi:gas vesicle protein
MGKLGFMTGMVLGGAAGLLVGTILAPEDSELQQEARALLDEIIQEGKRAAEMRRLEMERRLEEAKKGEFTA